MKRTLSMIALAALTIGLLGSCSKINERLDNLEKDVNGLKNEKIASIESQIAGITSSIADLGTIRSDISSLKQSAENHGIDIFNLEEADRALADRILNLEDYLDDVLPKFAEKEWVEATFSTLEQYDSTCTAITEINVRIGELDARTARDIQACADSMKTWVNEQLDAYYTAAQMDAKLAKMKSAVDSARAANKITDAKADSIARELAKTKTAVDSAKANIRKEYKAAIKSAIDSSEARLTKKIQNKIDKVNKNVEELAGRVSVLEAAVADLTGRVEKLEGMIQSVVIVPAYSDGSVKVEDDTLFIDLSVTPKEAVATLGKDSVKILLNRVQTKAVVLDTVPTDSIKVFTKETKNGTVSIQAYIPTFLAELGDESLTVAVNVKNGISDFTTEFVPVNVFAPVAPEGFVYLGVKDANGKPLYWAEKNLGASNPEDYGDYFAWGETAPYYTTTGGWPETPAWKEGKTSGYKWVSYCGQSSFVEWSTPPYDATSKILLPAYDAATKTNSSWRTPTSDEFKALAAGCVWIRTTDYNSTGKAGYIVYKAKNDADKGKAYLNDTWKKWNGSSFSSDSATTESYSISDTHIFFPAAGYGDGTSLNGAGSYGFYWSSSLQTSYPHYAYILYFSSSDVDPQNNYYRYSGFPVRPVTSGVAPAPTPTEPDFVVMKMGSGQSKTLKWRKMNLGATTIAGSASTCYGNLYSWGNPTGSDGDNITSPGFTSGNYQEPGKSISKAGDWVTATHDAAYKELGGKWRMPTSQEFKDLADACGGSDSYDSETYESPATCGEATTFSQGIYWCDSYDGVAGCLFCDGTNKLFFPAAGFSYSDSRSNGGPDGLYWSSTWYSSANAYSLYFNSVNVIPQDNNIRYNGFPVRPVSD